MLDFEEYGDAIGEAWTVLREHANRSGPQARTVTAPDWTLRDLVAHQGMVHRWAAGHVRGQDVDPRAVEAEGLSETEQLAWFDDCARDLLQALADAPADLDVPFFLADPPPPRIAWARRQAHETTLHAVDAMSASLGRPPLPRETWFRRSLATDGVDELLTGFAPRRKQLLRSDTPLTVLVESTDTGEHWTMTVSPDPVVTVRGEGGPADVVLTGSATELYLGLWNRGDDLTCSDPDFLAQWREQMRIPWH